MIFFLVEFKIRAQIKSQKVSFPTIFCQNLRFHASILISIIALSCNENRTESVQSSLNCSQLSDGNIVVVWYFFFKIVRTNCLFRGTASTRLTVCRTITPMFQCCCFCRRSLFRPFCRFWMFYIRVKLLDLMNQFSFSFVPTRITASFSSFNYN